MIKNPNPSPLEICSNIPSEVSEGSNNPLISMSDLEGIKKLSMDSF